jgi:threonine synthase
MEGCRHAGNARIFILYPHGRPSDVQRRQMTTVSDPDVHALAVEGNFDDCQTIVKTLFGDFDFRTSQNLSAVNSINWARIAAQTVYYVHTAFQFAEPVNFIVPTGNFGNVYAAYVAKQMGAPIRRLVVASNRNDILTRFFETGTMKTGQVEPSLSPSMDIQISSNFERLLFDLLGRNAEDLKQMMADLKSGSFTLRDYDYVIDPHTAVAFHSYERMKQTLDGQSVILACAHPAKFPDAVEKAIGERPALPGKLADLYDRQEHFTVLPNDAEAVKAFILKS